MLGTLLTTDTQQMCFHWYTFPLLCAWEGCPSYAVSLLRWIPGKLAFASTDTAESMCAPGWVGYKMVVFCFKHATPCNYHHHAKFSQALKSYNGRCTRVIRCMLAHSVESASNRKYRPFPFVVIFFRGWVSEVIVPSYSVGYFLLTLGKQGSCFH